MLEALADGAVKMGLNRDTAQKLAAQTFLVTYCLLCWFLLNADDQLASFSALTLLVGSSGL